MRDADSLVGKMIADRFHVQDLLGVGGMGAVYRAKHVVLDRPFAIKVIRQPLIDEPDMTARFRREARTASRVEHPNITSVFDYGYLDAGQPYLVMEYVEGPTLADLIKREGGLPLTRALPILLQLADALAAAHRASIMHRDLKPHNIILTRDRRMREKIKVLDFGLAKVLGTGVTSDVSAGGEVFGSPSYMAPEQCLDAELDYRVDIYAFGIIAYELVVGEPPFRGNIMKVMQAHLHQPVPLPSEESGRSELAPTYDNLVLRCMAKRVDERYADVLAMIRDLQPLSDGQGVALQTIGSGFHFLQAGSGDATVRVPTVEALTGEVITTPGEMATDHDAAAEEETELEPAADKTAEAKLTPAQVVEELACIANDRGLGGPDLAVVLARKVVLEDRWLTLSASLQEAEDRIQRAEVLAREREARLRLALSQLEHAEQKTRSAISVAVTVPVSRATRSETGEGSTHQMLSGGRDEVIDALRAANSDFSRRTSEHQEEVNRLAEERGRIGNELAAVRQDLAERVKQLSPRLREQDADPEILRLLAAIGT